MHLWINFTSYCPPPFSLSLSLSLSIYLSIYLGIYVNLCVCARVCVYACDGTAERSEKRRETKTECIKKTETNNSNHAIFKKIHIFTLNPINKEKIR